MQIFTGTNCKLSDGILVGKLGEKPMRKNFELSSLLNDLLDKGALKRESAMSPMDIGTSLLAGISGTVAWADQAQQLTRYFLGNFSSALPLLILTFGFFWCLFAIQAKDHEPQQEAGFGRPTTSTTYHFQQITRWFCKFMLIVLVLLAPRVAFSMADEIWPLPSEVYGYLENQKTGDPIEGARLRILSSEGIDVAPGHWLSDSNGYYTIRSSKRFTRLAHLEVSHPDCKSELLPLRREFQLDDDSELHPIFKHLLDCPAENTK